MKWVLEGDIQGCFDHISHDWLMTHLPTDRVILKKWLKAGYVYRHRLFPTAAGTPQGGIISPVVANMTLDGLQVRLAEKFPTAKRDRLKLNMVRYADDFIITGHSKEWLEHEVKPVLVEFLAERGLVLSPEKTRITPIEEGFEFLGWNIRQYHGKLLIKPSKANVNAHLHTIREIIKGNKATKQVDLIKQINPVIRGWANYHRHVVAKKTFARNDNRIWSMLWQWATRRHPNKGARWIKEKYFQRHGTRNWVFAATEKQPDGNPREITLLKESDTPIQRHVKIKADANPHDPCWATYFEARWAGKMRGSARGRRKLYRVWQDQDGLCPTCRQPIAMNLPWTVRHIVKTTNGGTDAAGNLRIYHTDCQDAPVGQAGCYRVSKDAFVEA